MPAKLETRRLCATCPDFHSSGKTILRRGGNLSVVGQCWYVPGAVLPVHANQNCVHGRPADSAPVDTSKERFNALF